MAPPGDITAEVPWRHCVINGVLFPGGAGDDLYRAKAEFIYKEAVKKNDGGEYFPLFGICMGF